MIMQTNSSSVGVRAELCVGVDINVNVHVDVGCGSRYRCRSLMHMQCHACARECASTISSFSPDGRSQGDTSSKVQ